MYLWSRSIRWCLAKVYGNKDESTHMAVEKTLSYFSLLFYYSGISQLPNKFHGHFATPQNM